MVAINFPETVMQQINLYQQARGIDSVSEAVVTIVMEFFDESRGAIAPDPLALEDDIEDEPDEILYGFIDPE